MRDIFLCCSPRFTGIQQNTTHTCTVGITRALQGETTTSKNWQKVSKLFPSWSYSGCCGIETPTTLFNEITKIAKQTDFFDFFTIDNNWLAVWNGYFTPTFLIFKISVRFLCTQKLQAWHLIELIPTPLLHTPQGNLLPSTGLGALWTLTKIFVLPTLTRIPLYSRLAFQTLNFSGNSFNVSAMITRSSP